MRAAHDAQVIPPIASSMLLSPAVACPAVLGRAELIVVLQSCSRRAEKWMSAVRVAGVAVLGRGCRGGRCAGRCRGGVAGPDGELGGTHHVAVLEVQE